MFRFYLIFGIEGISMKIIKIDEISHFPSIIFMSKICRKYVKKRSLPKPLSQPPETGLYAILRKREIRSTVPNIGWDLHDQTDEHQQPTIEDNGGYQRSQQG